VKQYKHILVATNLSDESIPVIAKASDIASTESAILNIVHVLESSPLVYGGEYALALPESNIDESIEKHALEMLNQQAEKFNIPSENRYLEKGTTIAAIIHLLTVLNVDLLIVGNHELHGVGLLIGSTANTMLHKMPCDVLAVRI
jgi:universal stress protein A